MEATVDHVVLWTDDPLSAAATAAGTSRTAASSGRSRVSIRDMKRK